MSEQLVRQALTRMNLRPVAIAPHYSGFLVDMQLLSAAVPDVEQERLAARRADLCTSYGLMGGPQNKPFAFSQGVAIIPVHGTLLNRFGSSWGFVTGYNFLRTQTALAGMDPDVSTIVFDCNSNGGEAAGCFEYAAEIPALAQGKKTCAIIDSNCYSACYAIASQCDEIVCTPSGGAGSVGVVAMHVDMSAYLESAGVKITYVYSGDHKVDGNPYEPLPDAVRDDIQAGVHASRQDFAQLVANGRGLDLQAVLDTEARCYSAAEALSLGLIDAIATPTQALRAYVGGLSGSQSTSKGSSMSTNADLPGGDPQAAAAEARTAERTRIAGIQGCAEAEGRKSLADHLALNTDLSVDAAKAILAASPKVTPKAETANPFAAAMATGNPNVGAEGGAAAAAAGGEEPAHLRILRSQQSATGLKLIK